MRLQARHYRSGEALTLEIERGRIAAIGPADQAPELPWVAPALVDLQINGFGGHDFNDPDDDVEALAAAIWQSGTGRFCPTLITGSPDRLLGCAKAIAQACERNPQIDYAVVGIHLEGPAISPEDGPRGAHPREWVRPLTWDEFTRLQEACGQRIRIVTLAPESPGALDLIARLNAAGVIVAIGHTAAAPEQIRAAVSAGARMSTHLGNGAHPVVPRHPNYIWEQLADDTLWAGAIADGHHLPASVLKVFARVKGRRLVLVSDAVRLAGLPPGAYQDVIGGDVIVTETGRLHLAHDPRILAGAARSLWHGVTWAAYCGAQSIADALDAAGQVPSALLGLRHDLQAGLAADLMLVADQRAGAVPRVMLQGEWLN